MIHLQHFINKNNHKHPITQINFNTFFHQKNIKEKQDNSTKQQYQSTGEFEVEFVMLKQIKQDIEEKQKCQSGKDVVPKT